MSFKHKLAAIGLAASITIGGTSALANQDLFAELEIAAQEARELELKSPLNVSVQSRDELREQQQSDAQEVMDAESLSDYHQLLVFLGYIEEGDNMQEIQNSFSGDSVLGYYNPETKELVIVSTSGDEMNITDKATFVHETIHALQDQHFDLDSIFFDNEDMSDDLYFARLSLIEGDATMGQIVYLTQNDLFDQLIAEEAEMDFPDYDDIPFFLVESTFFPYNEGALFVLDLWNKGGWELVNEAWENPPSTTEQIIHPEKFLDGEGAKPVIIADPLDTFGGEWRLLDENENGQLVTRIFLQNGGASSRDANKASEGWGGDRQYIITNDEETASVWASSWDTEEDADEYFEILAETEVERLGADRTDVDDDTVTFTADGWYGEIHRDGENITYYLTQSEDAMETMISSQENATPQESATPVASPEGATPVSNVAFWVREN